MIINTKKQTLENVASKYRKDLIENATLSELLYKKHLDDEKIKYEFQKIILHGNNFFIVDFFIPEFNLIVEIDGGYHNTEEQKEKDNLRTLILNKKGYTVKRYTNEEINEKYYDEKINYEFQKKYVRNELSHEGGKNAKMEYLNIFLKTGFNITEAYCLLTFFEAQARDVIVNDKKLGKVLHLCERQIKNIKQKLTDLGYISVQQNGFVLVNMKRIQKKYKELNK